MKTLTYHKQAYLDMDSIKTYFNFRDSNLTMKPLIMEVTRFRRSEKFI